MKNQRAYTHTRLSPVRLESLARTLGQVARQLRNTDRRTLRPIDPAERVSAYLDRYQWGIIVARSLAPQFTSRAFAECFVRPLPAEAKETFDPVRLKKILQRLCLNGEVEVVARGRGRTAAEYSVKSGGSQA